MGTAPEPAGYVRTPYSENLPPRRVPGGHARSRPLPGCSGSPRPTAQPPGGPTASARGTWIWRSAQSKFDVVCPSRGHWDTLGDPPLTRVPPTRRHLSFAGKVVGGVCAPNAPSYRLPSGWTGSPCPPRTHRIFQNIPISGGKAACRGSGEHPGRRERRRGTFQGLVRRRHATPRPEASAPSCCRGRRSCDVGVRRGGPASGRGNEGVSAHELTAAGMCPDAQIFDGSLVARRPPTGAQLPAGSLRVPTD